MITPQNILNDPFLNKGTAFTRAERKALGLTGLVPPVVQTLDQQVAQSYGQFQSKSTDLEKHLFLMEIFNTNRVLFYKLFSQHTVEFMPIVYDPTIAETIENYSELYIQSQGAAFLSIDEDDATIAETLRNAAGGRQIKLIVVTDQKVFLESVIGAQMVLILPLVS